MPFKILQKRFLYEKKITIIQLSKNAGYIRVIEKHSKIYYWKIFWKLVKNVWSDSTIVIVSKVAFNRGLVKNAYLRSYPGESGFRSKTPVLGQKLG